MKTSTFVWRASALVAVVMVAAAPALAQGKWWQSERFTKELGLTQEQTRRCEEIFRATLPTLRAQKTLLDKAETALDTLVERGGDNAIMEQLNHVEIARAELNKTRFRMLIGMRKVLTQDQWAKFTALHQATEREQAQKSHAGK